MIEQHESQSRSFELRWMSQSDQQQQQQLVVVALGDTSGLVRVLLLRRQSRGASIVLDDVDGDAAAESMPALLVHECSFAVQAHAMGTNSLSMQVDERRLQHQHQHHHDGDDDRREICVHVLSCGDDQAMALTKCVFQYSLSSSSSSSSASSLASSSSSSSGSASPYVSTGSDAFTHCLCVRLSVCVCFLLCFFCFLMRLTDDNDDADE